MENNHLDQTTWQVLKLLIEAHFAPTPTYLAQWNIERGMGVELAGCGCPGHPALEILVQMGLIREMPDLSHRYELIVKESTNVQPA